MKRPPRAEADGPEAPAVPAVSGGRFTIGGEEFAVVAIPLAEPSCLEALTETEREVCRLVVRGMKSADIAKARGTATSTVHNQIASIFRKLHIHSRSELAALWESPR
jgi:DNA-binding NarL/FixJ family response regulator